MPDEFSLEGWNRANYTIWSGKARDFRTVYHCIFTCPFTGTHYPCGQLEKSQLVAIDGAFWYSMAIKSLNTCHLFTCRCNLLTQIFIISCWLPEQKLRKRHCKQPQRRLTCRLPKMNVFTISVLHHSPCACEAIWLPPRPLIDGRRLILMVDAGVTVSIWPNSLDLQPPLIMLQVLWEQKMMVPNNHRYATIIKIWV